MQLRFAAAILLAAGVMSTSALAQPTPGQEGVVASQPVPDTAQASPGIPSSQAVNPAPNATGPYVGAGRSAFYDVGQRIQAMSQAAQSLPTAQRRRADAALRSIKSEEATQRARHGGMLRDWDRESLSVKLDKLAREFPSLGSEGQNAPASVQ